MTGDLKIRTPNYKLLWLYIDVWCLYIKVGWLFYEIWNIILLAPLIISREFRNFEYPMSSSDSFIEYLFIPLSVGLSRKTNMNAATSAFSLLLMV